MKTKIIHKKKTLYLPILLSTVQSGKSVSEKNFTVPYSKQIITMFSTAKVKIFLVHLSAVPPVDLLAKA